jgi:hypothetical protein
VEFVSTEERSADVKNAVAMVFVCTVRERADVLCVEAVVSVFMIRTSTSVPNANGSKGKLISSV